MPDFLQGLLLLSPEVLLFVALGVAISTVFVITPGLGGLFALAIMLPFAFTLGPVAGIALILGVSVISGTGNTIPSILFGIPGSAGFTDEWEHFQYAVANRSCSNRPMSVGRPARKSRGVPQNRWTSVIRAGGTAARR
jgi:TctA family transporter